MHKRKSEEEANRNIRSSIESLSLTNDPLLPILDTKTTAERNDATKEPIEDDFLEELQSNTRGALCQKINRNRKNPKNQEKGKPLNKKNLEQK